MLDTGYGSTDKGKYVKSIKPLVTRQDFIQFFDDFWHTEPFRKSWEESGYVWNWVRRLMRRPIFLFEMDVPEVEKCHFYPWFASGIGLREDHYDNPAITDLHMFHEIVHMATLEYNPEVPWTWWKEKMALNEQLSSIESEVVVYFELDGLREISFEEEIWADRFLEMKLLRPTRYHIIEERKRATVSPEDDIEDRISLYAWENDKWARIWKDRWKEVEEKMQELTHADYPRSILAGMVRSLRKEEPYPYANEAEEFAKVYHQARGTSDSIQLS